MGAWHPRDFKENYVKTREDAKIKHWSSQGFNDPMPYPGFTVEYDPKKILDIAKEIGIFDENLKPEVAKSRLEAEAARALRFQERNQKKEEQRKEAQAYSEWQQQTIDRVKDILDSAPLPEGSCCQKVGVANYDKETGKLWLSLKWLEEKNRNSHEIFTETNEKEGNLEEAALRIRKFLEEGGKVPDLFVKL